MTNKVKRCILLLLLATLTLGVTRSVWVQVSPWGFPNDDAAVYLSIGRQLWNGLVPYRDMWDHKPPVIYLLTAVGWGLNSASPLGSWVVFGFLLVMAWLAWMRLVHSSCPAPSGPMLLVSSVFCLLLATNTGWGIMTETVVFCFSSIAIALAHEAWRRHVALLLCGVAIAISSLSKQQCVGDVLAVCAVVVLGERYREVTWKRLGLVACGFALVYVSMLGVLVQWGALREAWECFVYNFPYAASRRFGIVFSDRSFYVPLVVFLLAVLTIIRDDIRRRFRDSVWILVVVVVWFGVAWTVSTGGHEHNMVLLWTPVMFSVVRALCCLSVGAGLTIEGVTVTEPSDRVGFMRFAWMTVAVAIICGGALLYSGNHWEWRWYSKPSIVEKLNLQLADTDTVFVCHGSGGRLWTGLNMRPACRRFYFEPLALNGYADLFIKEVMAALSERPPKCLVIDKNPHPYFRELQGYIRLEQELRRFAVSRRYAAMKTDEANYDIYIKKE